MPELSAPPVEPLFRGAARLGLVLGMLDLPWQRVAPLVAAFPAELRDDLEVGIADHGAAAWVQTRVDGKPGVFRMARFLETHGAPEAALRRLLVTAEHGGHRHLLLQVGIDARGPSAFGWALRRPTPLPEAQAFLAAAGASTETLARLGLVAEALERTEAHALGAELADGRVTERVSFAQEVEGSSWPRLDLALERTGLDGATLGLLARHMPALAGRGTRLHLRVRDGVVVGADLDVEHVPDDVLASIQADRPAWRDRVATLLTLAQRPVATRAVLRLESGQPLGLTAWTRVEEPPA